MKVPFARPFFSMEDEDEIQSGIRNVLRSGWLTSGKNVELLEKEFAQLVGTRFAVAVNSCTAALHSVLISLNLKAGDEVLVPSNTFVATANSVLYTGAKPVFVDSDVETFNISPTDCEEKITPRTRAIIVVHLAGNPCDMKRFSEMAEDHRIDLIEDCAHAHGSKFQGTNCGSFGIAGAFSFYATKVVTACEGGVVTTDDSKLAERVKRIRNQGRGGYGPQEIIELGHNYRMSDVHAVIGLSQLRHLSGFVHERQEIAERYEKLLSDTKWVTPQKINPGDTCAYYAYIVRLAKAAPLQRDEVVKKLDEQGIETSVLYHPAHNQPLYRTILPANHSCPTAVELGRSTLALPMFNGMGSNEFDYFEEKWRGTVEPYVEQYAGTN